MCEDLYDLTVSEGFGDNGPALFDVVFGESEGEAEFFDKHGFSFLNYWNENLRNSAPRDNPGRNKPR